MREGVRARPELVAAGIVWLALAAVLYHAASVLFTLNGAMQHYSAHLAFALVLGALGEIAAARRTGARTGLRSAVLVAALAATAASIPYLYLQASALEMSQPFLDPLEVAIGLLLISAVLALTWIIWGGALGLICALAAAYFAFGQHVPAIAVGIPQPPEVVISYLAGMGGPRGVYTYLPLSADTIFLLLVYGGLMRGTLVLEVFVELGKSVGNLFRGGVAFSSMCASTLVGMVTGQTVSAIALTGSVNIPTMVNRGFTKEEAGSIEVLSANGSQIIPPVMGLGAFLMAVVIGIPYTEIATAAVLPAALYVIAVGIGAYILIQASPNIPYTREKVDWRLVVWSLPAFLASFVVLVVMLYMQFTAGMAALWGMALLIGGSLLRPRAYRPSWPALRTGLVEGAMAGAHLGVILAGIGVIVQMLVTTGLGMGLSRIMIDMTANSLELGLLIGMVIALLIGMGLPTPAAYSLCAIVVIPALIDVGVEPLVAHFYGFYFAVFSSITPPVAVGVLMASRISGGSFARTAIESFKLGGIGLLLPFFFVAYPDVLRFPNVSLETVFACGLFLLGTLMLAAVIYGALGTRLSHLHRAALALGPVSILLYYDTRVVVFAVVPLVVFAAVVAMRRTGAVAGPEMTGSARPPAE